MAHFRCTTQVNGLLGLNGPSGKSYESHLGLSFVVEDPLDIEYFKNKRQFEEVGLIARVLEKPGKTPHEILEEYLKKAKVSKQGVEEILARYPDVETFQSEVKSGQDVSTFLDKKDVDTVTKKIKRS